MTAFWLTSAIKVVARVNSTRRQLSIRVRPCGFALTAASAEVAAYPEIAQRFEQMDANKNSYISRDELGSKRRSICD